MPTFFDVADKLKGKIKFGSINGNTENNLLERFNVMMFPTLIFIK